MDTELIITDEFLKQRPLSASSLKAFRKSPKHYIEYITAPREYKDFFAIGLATEALILEPDDFDKNFEVYTKFAKRSGADKARWEKMLIDAKENKKTLIDTEQFADAKLMSNSALETPESLYFIEHKKEVQKKLQWTDRATKLPVIGFVDFTCELDENHDVIIDIKTAANGDPDKFIRDSSSLEYEIQVGSYLSGYKNMYYQFPDFMFMVIEKSAPWNTTMMHCPPDYAKYAMDEFEHTLQAFRYCMDQQEFDRGYHFWSSEMGYFNMEKPRWKKSKLAGNE